MNTQIITLEEDTTNYNAAGILEMYKRVMEVG